MQSSGIQSSEAKEAKDSRDLCEHEAKDCDNEADEQSTADIGEVERWKLTSAREEGNTSEDEENTDVNKRDTQPVCFCGTSSPRGPREEAGGLARSGLASFGLASCGLASCFRFADHEVRSHRNSDAFGRTSLKLL